MLAPFGVLWKGVCGAILWRNSPLAVTHGCLFPLCCGLDVFRCGHFVKNMVIFSEKTS